MDYVCMYEIKRAFNNGVSYKSSTTQLVYIKKFLGKLNNERILKMFILFVLFNGKLFSSDNYVSV